MYEIRYKCRQNRGATKITNLNSYRLRELWVEEKKDVERNKRKGGAKEGR